jgi:hypothetical protein
MTSNEARPQKIWRNLSIPEASGCGYFLWEVMEVVGESDPQSYFTECRDGSYVLIVCMHSFTREYFDEYEKNNSNIRGILNQVVITI